MTAKIILSADSTCDLGDELKALNHVHYFPLHITLGGKLYTDNVDITPPQIFAIYRRSGELPKTSAVNVSEYQEHFEQWTKNGHTVIHVNIGSSLSSAHHNAVLAAEQVAKNANPGEGSVHVIDSGNLSTGTGLLVLAVAERIAQGLAPDQIVAEVEALRPHIHASFVLDTLEFLRAGGRCSAVQAIASSLLKIKPCIEVDNRDGAMDVGKKYRGNIEKAYLQYTQDKLDEYGDSIDFSRIFITNVGVSQETIDSVVQYLGEHADFKDIYITSASCTISSHCGPGTLGLLFMTR